MRFEDYLEIQGSALQLISRYQLESFLEGLIHLRDSDGTLWILGNGGSASAASHAVADFNKTTSTLGSRPIRSIAISEMIALLTAYANDTSYENTFSGPLQVLAREQDGVLLISVSGKSPNIAKAIETSKDLGLKTFCIFGQKGAELANRVDFPIIIPSEDYQLVENIHLMLVHWLVKNL